MAVRHILQRALPAPIREPLLSAYHFTLSICAAFLYGFPSRSIIVIAVTGTKGKSSTVEFVNAALEGAGWKTAVASTIRIKVGDQTEPNLKRMTMPGRFFMQQFLRQAVDAGCRAAIIEMTSEGARQHRHRFIALDALIFLNLSPEHIESHGSYQAYANAKFRLGSALVHSSKRPRIMVTNADDTEGTRYTRLPVEIMLPFSLSAETPWEATESGGYFTHENTRVAVRIGGEFSLKNALAALLCARALGADFGGIVMGIGNLTTIPGRVQHVDEGQDFLAVVDYAHTPDSLTALYGAHASRRKICVLGSTGGGRDTWKRPVMGEIADRMCDEVILTNEDPYDEEPRSIVDMIASGMKRPPIIIMDRREAIARALSRAHAGDAVLITGKGTDPCICGPGGTKEPWSDAEVTREELRKLQKAQ